ncbi:MAG: glycosyltransferase family 4 protein, partial [Clostridiales bacterium]|nr:glycosyltransferase family 4 protein [Clostridiales bacterium]
FSGQFYNILDPRYQSAWKYIKNSHDEIKYIIDKESPDIVILNSMTISWMVDCIDSSIKTICFDRETFPKNGRDMRSKMVKGWLSQMTKSVYLSEYDRVIAGAHDNSCVITDKVDIAKFEDIQDHASTKCALGLDFDKKYILFAGGMWKVKGSHTALEMMHHLDDEYHLIFLQYIPNEKNVSSTRTIIKKIFGIDYEKNTLRLLEGIKDRVRFFPAQEDMLPFYAACNVVIFPSTQPHQARPVYEAGAALRPAVISDFENTKEFAKNYFNVLTFKQGDAKALAACIEKLHDNQLYYLLSDNGHKMCKENHDLSALEQEIISLIKDVEENN